MNNNSGTRESGLLDRFADDYEQRQGAEFYLSPSNWPLFIHTARNMTSTQLTGILERKLRHAVVPRLPINFDERYKGSIPGSTTLETRALEENNERLRSSLTGTERARFQELVSDVRRGRFTFLNHTIEFEGGIEWSHPEIDEQPLLWRLKLQSFTHLEWAVLGHDSSDNHSDLIQQLDQGLADWERKNPIGEPHYLRRSWIPHSVSLRVLNLSRYLAWRTRTGNTDNIGLLHRLIFKNALFLENHIEYEVGGNHLIENAIALIVAGVIYRHERSDWVTMGLRILRQGGESQFLNDGGHFERSPMYHVMVLRRYITACDLLRGREYNQDSILGVTRKALGFLLEVSDFSGDIPLLNDSVHGEQLSASACIEYGRNCSLEPSSVSLDAPGGSGYRLLDNDIGALVLDVGEIGPPHLPAHSHNDQLSILLWTDDRPVLTDTGVYNYAPNSRRQYSKSVQAHNTAQLDTVEPIQTGGRYLMGKRSSPSVVDQDSNFIAAEFTRQGLLERKYTHRREITTAESGWEISDIVWGDSERPVSVRFHFAPSCEIENRSEEFVIHCGADSPLSFSILGAESVAVSQSPIFEYYGQESLRPMIEAKTSVESEITTEIRTLNTDL